MDLYPGRGAKAFSQSRHDTAWQLIKAYWQSDQRFPAYLFFTIVLVLTTSLVGLYIILNYWYYHFYDVLAAYDDHRIARLIIVSGILILFYGVLALYRLYLSQRMERGLRQWLMERFESRWLLKRGGGRCKKKRKEKQYDENIRQEIRGLINFSVDFSIELISALTAFWAALYIIWELTGEATLRIGNVTLPSYFVCLMLFYGALTLFFTFKLGRPLFSLRAEQDRQEAALRYGPKIASLECISDSSSTQPWWSSFARKALGRLFKNPYLKMLQQKLLVCVGVSCSQAGVVLPLVLVLPDYCDKLFYLGWLVQYLQSFISLQVTLTYIMSSYPINMQKRTR